MNHRWLLGLTSVALLTACAGEASRLAVQPDVVRHVAPDLRPSWMLPHAKIVKKLLYVSDGATNDVYVYDFDSGRLVGTLTGFKSPWGQCVDARGDVWITDSSAATVTEYQHGFATPLRTLSTVGSAWGCSVAPNGNLAVANLTGGLAVFKHARGKPTLYNDGENCYYMYFPGYDLAGNLYLEANNTSGEELCELPEGSDKLKGFLAYGLFRYQAGTMWDGKHLTLADVGYGTSQDETAIYQVVENGSGYLTKIGETILSDNCNGDKVTVGQPFIVGDKNTPVNTKQGTIVVGGDLACSNVFDYWKYPKGGQPYKRLKSAPMTPQGQSVSIAE